MLACFFNLASFSGSCCIFFLFFMRFMINVIRYFISRGYTRLSITSFVWCYFMFNWSIILWLWHSLGFTLATFLLITFIIITDRSYRLTARGSKVERLSLFGVATLIFNAVVQCFYKSSFRFFFFFNSSLHLETRCGRNDSVIFHLSSPSLFFFNSISSLAWSTSPIESSRKEGSSQNSSGKRLRIHHLTFYTSVGSLIVWITCGSYVWLSILLSLHFCIWMRGHMFHVLSIVSIHGLFFFTLIF